MTYSLFLDGTREPREVDWISLPHQNDWVIVRNFNEFVSAVEERGIPGHVSFEHDLSPEHYPKSSEDWLKPLDYSQFKEKTGMECAKWLVDYCKEKEEPFPSWSVHSQNPSGRKNILDLLTKNP